MALLPAAVARAQTGPGNVDDSFTLGQPGDAVGRYGVFSVVQQPDGKVLIGGAYDSIVGQRVGPFSRLNSDGSLDASFNRPVIESYNTRTDDMITVLDPRYVPVVRFVRRQGDGKILVGGNFYFVNGVAGYGGVLRLNSDGSVDSSFKAPRFGGTVLSIVPVADDKYIVSGDFDGTNAANANCLVRLKANGKIDEDFKPGAFVADFSNAPSVSTVAVQGDDKLIIGGLFSQIGGKPRPGLARLNKNGSLDNDYLPNGVADPIGIRADSTNQINTIVLQPDGKALVGAQIIGSIPNTVGNSLFRLNTDGSLDASFNQGGLGTDGVVNAILLESDGKILIGGGFSNYNDNSRRFFARLLPDGALDASFDPGVGANDAVFSLYQQDDGKLLISGYFRLVEQKTRLFVSRIYTDTAGAPAVTATITATSKRARFGNPVTKGIFTVQRSGGNQTVALPVYYVLSGAAQGGVDYRTLTGTVIIPANRTTARIKVKPLNNPDNQGKRKIVATLSLTSPSGLLNGGYSIGVSGRAVIKIFGAPTPAN